MAIIAGFNCYLSRTLHVVPLQENTAITVVLLLSIFHINLQKSHIPFFFFFQGAKRFVFVKKIGISSVKSNTSRNQYPFFFVESRFSKNA